MKMNNLTLIACVDNNWGIGRNGGLLFRLRRDMARFKELTTGNIVIAGRTTLDSLPGGKPLPDRVNIVLTRDKSFSRAGAVVCRSIDELCEALSSRPRKKAFVIGGGEIYRLLLPYCSEAYITRVDDAADADAYMVNLDNETDWRISDKSDVFTENNISYRFYFYERT